MKTIYSVLRRLWAGLNRRDAVAAPEPCLRLWADLPAHHPDCRA